MAGCACVEPMAVCNRCVCVAHCGSSKCHNTWLAVPVLNPWLSVIDVSVLLTVVVLNAITHDCL